MKRLESHVKLFQIQDHVESAGLTIAADFTSS